MVISGEQTMSWQSIMLYAMKWADHCSVFNCAHS